MGGMMGKKYRAEMDSAHTGNDLKKHEHIIIKHGVTL